MKIDSLYTLCRYKYVSFDCNTKRAENREGSSSLHRIFINEATLSIASSLEANPLRRCSVRRAFKSLPTSGPEESAYRSISSSPEGMSASSVRRRTARRPKRSRKRAMRLRGARTRQRAPKRAKPTPRRARRVQADRPSPPATCSPQGLPSCTQARRASRVHPFRPAPSFQYCTDRRGAFEVGGRRASSGTRREAPSA